MAKGCGELSLWLTVTAFKVIKKQTNWGQREGGCLKCWACPFMSGSVFRRFEWLINRDCFCFWMMVGKPTNCLASCIDLPPGFCSGL